MHTIVATLFAVFAALQYNDPDYYIWIPAYQLVTVLIIFSQKSKKQTKGLLLAIIGYGLWMLTYLSEVVDWLSNGLPSITDTMKAESPFVEFMREFFGLLLCLITCCFYWKRSRIKG